MDQRMRDLERRARGGDQEAFLELRRGWQRLRDPLRDPKPGDVVLAPMKGWNFWTHERREKEERDLLTGAVRAGRNGELTEIRRIVSIPGFPSWARLVRKVVLPDPEIVMLLSSPGTVWLGRLDVDLRATASDGTVRHVSRDEFGATMKGWGGLVHWESVSRWDVVERVPVGAERDYRGRVSFPRTGKCSLTGWRRWARGGRPVRDGLVVRMAEEIPI